MEQKKSQFARETAKICSIQQLQTGEYKIQEGWQPNYVLVENKKISRVNLMGLVVEKTTTYQFILDDGSASIQVTDFNKGKNTEKLQVGDPVLVIGRPRKTEEELFIASEIVTSKQLQENKAWLEHRKKELEAQQPKKERVQVYDNEQDEEDIIEAIETQEHNIEKEKTTLAQETTPQIEQLTGDDIVNFIRKKDTGEGVEIEEIIAYFTKEAEEVITTLLTMGEVYEIRPGKLKVLE